MDVVFQAHWNAKKVFWNNILDDKEVSKEFFLGYLDYYVNKFKPRLAANPGRFGPGSFRPESFRPGSFRPILGVGRFGLGRWVVSANFLGESIRS